MKLIGNSVSVPVIDCLVKAIIETGVFNELKEEQTISAKRPEAIKKSENKKGNLTTITELK